MSVTSVSDRVLHHPWVLIRARDFIEQNLHDPISIEDIARAAGCSGRMVHAVFQNQLGVPPITYLRHLRLDLVREALLTTDATVSDAAMRSGFTHLGRFSRAYFLRFGELPSQTRARAALPLSQSRFEVRAAA